MDNNGSNAAIRGKFHFIGIGGCSMNGLAQILRGRGFEVQGSDSTTSPFTKRLEELGIPVFIGHDPKNVEGCGTVIYSAAIKPDNPERVRARELGIPEIERSVALGIISRSYREVIGIAGCHGKTTITSMLALIAENGGLDATVHVGGMVDFLHGGIRLGSHDLFVTEACEYVESFLTLHPTVVLINNMSAAAFCFFSSVPYCIYAADNTMTAANMGSFSNLTAGSKTTTPEPLSTADSFVCISSRRRSMSSSVGVCSSME